MNFEDKQEAWEYTKNYEGKYQAIARYGGLFGMECKSVQLKFMPFKKTYLWSDEVNNWRDEMEEMYSTD